MSVRAFLLLACVSLGLHPRVARASSTDAFAQRFATARADYFRGLQGDHAAESRAAEGFAALNRLRPGDPVVLVYSGSLELLDAAQTWAVWNKHKLATEGLEKIDRAERLAPENLEVRFIHGATSWNLPFFYHRKQQAEEDFSFVGPRAEQAVRSGALPPQLGAAALDYYGRILTDRNDEDAARRAFAAAVRVDPASPAAEDASRRLRQTG